MSDDTLPHRLRAASALRALDEDVELARRRVWRRIQDGIELERRRERRRMRWLAGGVAAAVTAVAVLVPVAMNLGGGSAGPAPQQHDVSLASVAAMLGDQPGANGQSTDPEQFLTNFVTQATAGSE